MLATRHIARLVAVGAALHAARMRAKTSGGRAPGTPNGPVQALPPGLGMGTRRRMATARRAPRAGGGCAGEAGTRRPLRPTAMAWRTQAACRQADPPRGHGMMGP
jgi:hypothetical protein